jgi:carotenoid cleavage dioxygenase
MSGVKKYDLLSGQTDRYEYGVGRAGSECQIALKDKAVDEDDAYVLTLVTDMNENRSECLIMDAKALAKGPIARIILPHRIPTGAHACWVEADRIKGERS